MTGLGAHRAGWAVTPPWAGLRLRRARCVCRRIHLWPSYSLWFVMSLRFFFLAAVCFVVFASFLSYTLGVPYLFGCFVISVRVSSYTLGFNGFLGFPF